MLVLFEFMRARRISGSILCLGLAGCTSIQNEHASRADLTTRLAETSPQETLGVVAQKKPYLLDPDAMHSVSVAPDHIGTTSQWTDEEVAAIKKLEQASWTMVQQAICTPRQAAIYCTRSLTHGNHGNPWGFSIDDERFGCDYWMSGEYTHELKIVDCDDAAVTAASLLKDDGFHAYILCVQGITKVPYGAGRAHGLMEKNFGHAVFVYKTHEGKLGTIGINEGDIMIPEVCSIDEFLVKWSEQTKDEYTSWEIIDLGNLIHDYDTNRRNNNPEAK